MPGKISVAARVLATFLAGHGTVQILNVATGIFVLRSLSIEDYAQYSLAFAFQTTAISLTNLGLTDSIVPLVGNRADDPTVVGRYIRAAQALRNTLFLLVSPCVVLAFFVVVRNQGWSTFSQLIMLAPVMASLYLSVSVAGWSTPLLLKRRLVDFYLGQTIPALGRLASYVGARLLGHLSVAFALSMSAASILANGLIVKVKSRNLVQLPLQADSAAKAEVLRCMLPMMPSAIFTAFQPQVALFLVSIFGHTVQIAQIAALSRVAQLFLVFSTFNSVVIEPYVARVSAARLPAVYARILGSAALIGAVLTLLSFRFPELLTWILGAKYQDLDAVIGWVVLASAVSSTANVMWVMNRGRRWLFWRGSLIEISCLLLFQSLYVIFIGVRTTSAAAIFMLTASCAHFVAHAYIAWYGFSRHNPIQAA